MLQYLLTGLGIGCMYALVALGFVITYQGAKFFNFAHGESFMLGAMGAFALTTGLDIPVVPAILIAGGGVSVLAMVAERVVFRRFVVTGSPAINAIIASIGLASLIRGTSQAAWGPDPESVPHVISGPGVTIGGAVIQRDLVVMMVATVLISALIYVLYRRTRAGVAIRATADRIRLVGLFGIELRTVLRSVFALAAFLGAIAGGLAAPLFKAQVTMGTNVLIKGFAAAILGGLTNIWGALVGGIALGVAESFGSRYIATSWTDVLSFGLVILMLVVKPEGLLGKRQVEKV